MRLLGMTAETRSRKFIRRAAELDVLSMLALSGQQGSSGALSLYWADKNGFDDDCEHVGLLFASHAAVAMSDALQQEHLIKAIGAGDLIEQAKDILMKRY